MCYFVVATTQNNMGYLPSKVDKSSILNTYIYITYIYVIQGNKVFDIFYLNYNILEISSS